MTPAETEKLKNLCRFVGRSPEECVSQGSFAEVLELLVDEGQRTIVKKGDKQVDEEARREHEQKWAKYLENWADARPPCGMSTIHLYELLDRLASTKDRYDVASMDNLFAKEDTTFEIKLIKEGGAKLGISIADHDTEFRITNTSEDGLVTAWNAMCPSMSVKVGDFLMKCNGKQSRDDILNELRIAKEIRLTIRPAQTTQDRSGIAIRCQ